MLRSGYHTILIEFKIFQLDLYIITTRKQSCDKAMFSLHKQTGIYSTSG